MPPTPVRTRPPAPKRPIAPTSDPRYKRVIEQLNQGTVLVKRHPSPAKKAAEASAAAKGPPNERAAGAKSNQVDKIRQAPAKKPESNSFLTMLRAEIAKVMPKTLGDTDTFMEGENTGELKGSLKSNVNQQRDAAAGAVKGASREAPKEGGVPAKAVTPIPAEPAVSPPSVNASDAMPAPKPDAEVSLQQSKQDADAQLRQAEVTPQQLRKANDPRFSAVLSAKGAVEKQADAGPARYRAGERTVISAAAAKASADAQKGAAAMLSVKGRSRNAVLGRQGAAKAKEEAERKAVTDHIEAIYTATRGRVEEKLNGLEAEVGALFDAGIDRAINAMKAYVNERQRRYKLERYLSIPLVGLARWVADQFKGLPAEVNVFYEQGRALFTQLMDALVVSVSNLVERRLREAKDEVAKGQAEIKTYVAGLPKNLQAVGQAAQREVAGRFEELERGIEDKKNQLAQQLAEKYKEASSRADEALKSIQDENKGLVASFVEKLGEVLKMLAEFKAKLMAVIKKGEEALKLVLADPIGFLGNLLAALKKGFNQFVDNIWTHLKKGFMTWLFGELAQTGVAIPTDLSLPSILKLVLSILGLTWERAKAEAIKLIGPTAVAIITKLIEYMQALWSGGPAALWEKLKEDLSNLKAMVIDALQDWLITTIVKKAVAKVVSMFNPVGAIIQAISMIYGVVMFVIERAAQILSFVEAVIDSVAAIARGNIASAANLIEQSLAKLVPVVIGLLASLLGLGGIGAKIKELVTKAGDLVWGAIRKFLKKAIDFVKKMWGKLTGKKDKPDERTDAQKKADLDKGVAEADALLADEKLSSEDVAKKLPGIQAKYKLASLTIVTDAKGEEEETDHIEGEVNPKRKAIQRKKAAKDGQTNIKVKRSKFTVTTKWTLAGDFPGEHRKLVRGDRPPPLKKQLDRRHVISSQTMAAHYESVLNAKKWSEAQKILNGKGEEVKAPLGNKKIQEAAQARHSRFFNDVKNLFIGDASTNRSIGAATDIPEDWADRVWRKHLRYIKTTYALSDSFTA